MIGVVGSVLVWVALVVLVVATVRLRRVRRELERLVAEYRRRLSTGGSSCPYVVTSDEGTSYCSLAERGAREEVDP